MSLSLSERSSSLCGMYGTSCLKSFEFVLGFLWVQIKMLCKVLEFIDQVCLLFSLFVDLINNKCQNHQILLKKSENLQGIRLLVYHVVKKSFKWFWKSWTHYVLDILDLENFEPFKIWISLNFIEFSVFQTLTISNWKVMNTKNSQLIKIYKVHLGHIYILHHLVLKESCF
jgi:hypothetical protein